MKEYELTILVHPDLESDLEEPLEKVRQLIVSGGGKVLKETNWGKKKLAYKISKQDFAIYVNFELNMPPLAVAKLSAALNITEELLRYLLVSVDEKTKAKLADVNKRRTEAKDEEGDRR